MPRIVEDDKYDFNFQVDRNLHEEVTVFPADQLITECIYNTEDRKNPTFVSNFFLHLLHIIED